MEKNKKKDKKQTGSNAVSTVDASNSDSQHELVLVNVIAVLLEDYCMDAAVLGCGDFWQSVF
jgi:hypothetical protein